MEHEVILIGSNQLGQGDPELGGKILVNFLRLLGERAEKPEYIILWNGGAKLAVRDSDWCPHLQNLEKQGITILICQTCVEFFGITDKLAVGKVTGMVQIQDILFARRVLTL